MDQDIIHKVKQARIDEDVAGIEKIIRSAKNHEEKIAIMTALCGYNKPIVGPKLEFNNEVTDLYAKLSAEDSDIAEFLETHSQRFLEAEVYGKLGSGVNMRPLNYYLCSNIYPSHNGQFCHNQGKHRCTQCGLVAYCSKLCQKEHWEIHKKNCRESLFSSKWKPLWVEQKRQLPFIMDKSSKQQMAYLKARVWGDQPAFDLIGFKRNEHKDSLIWKNPINIAFVAGDFRSVVETLASVPDDYQQPITIVLNDENPVIAARNLFMLSLLLVKGEEALDMVIAIWYSAKITQNQHVTTGEFLMSLLDAGNQLEQGLSSIELNDMKTPLDTIQFMIFKSLEINKRYTMDNRDNIMFVDVDFVDRVMLGLKEYQRDSFFEFLSVGLLLPYCNDNILKDWVNPFLILSEEKWLIDVTCDPKQVWSMLDVMKFGDQKRLPNNDLYGRLFFYVRDRLSRMISTMRRLPIKVRMFQKDPKILAKELKSSKFDRIDLTNPADEDNSGIEKMLNIWGPLLNKDNPYSAIITLSHNWHYSIPKSAKIPSEMDPDLLYRLVSLIGLDRAKLIDMNDPTNKFLIQHAGMAFDDHSEEFEKCMEKIEKNKAVKRRMEHTIVPHQVMFPIESKPNTTIESLPENDQYWIFNCIADPTDRYSEWTLVEQS